jgi:hypothetical protein
MAVAIHNTAIGRGIPARCPLLAQESNKSARVVVVSRPFTVECPLGAVEVVSMIRQRAEIKLFDVPDIGKQVMAGRISPSIAYGYVSVVMKVTPEQLQFTPVSPDLLPGQFGTAQFYPFGQ